MHGRAPRRTEENAFDVPAVAITIFSIREWQDLPELVARSPFSERIITVASAGANV